MRRGGRHSRWAVAGAGLLAAGLAAAALWAGGERLLPAGSWRWIRPAVTSRAFVLCGLIALGCAAALTWIGCALYRLGAAGRAARGRGEDGAAMIEFALSLLIALPLTLIMIQSSLLMVGNLCVHYAAFCGARSAIVQVPWVKFLPGEQPNEIAGADDSGKMLRIRSAVAWALMPVACAHPDAPGADAGALEDALESFFQDYGRPVPAWVRGRLSRQLQYVRDHTHVEVDPPTEPPYYGVHEDLRVRVEHVFYLAVPLAARLFYLMDDDGRDLDFGSGQYATVLRATCALPNEGVTDIVAVEPFLGSAGGP